MFLANQVRLIALFAAYTASISRWRRLTSLWSRWIYNTTQFERWRRLDTFNNYSHIHSRNFASPISQDHNPASKLATRKPCQLIDTFRLDTGWNTPDEVYAPASTVSKQLLEHDFTMWFFGCGSRKNGSTGCSSSRYPSNGKSRLTRCFRRHADMSLVSTVNPYTTQQYYPTGMASPSYYSAPGHTYAVPPPRYVVPQPPARTPYYSYATAPPPYVPASATRSGAVRTSQGPTKSQASAASGSRITSGSANSGRKVTFGRVDVREFGRRGRSGGT
jgi:hypothetical protein